VGSERGAPSDELDLSTACRKLEALENSVSALLASRESVGSIHQEDCLVLWRQYRPIAAWARTHYPRLLGDLPDLPEPRDNPDDYFNSLQVVFCNRMLRDIRSCIRLLRGELPAAHAEVRVVTEGIFLSGEVFDAIRALTGITGTAKSRIDIIDGYVNESVLDLLSGKLATIAVRILTYAVTESFAAHAHRFNKQYGGLTVRQSREFHDRFIIVDEASYYHLGASIKDAGSRGFMFSRIEEPLVIERLSTVWQTEWERSKEVVPGGNPGTLP